MNKNQVAVEFVRAFIFSICVLTFYLLTATIPIPSLLGLGEIRVLVVSLFGFLAEHTIFYVFKNLSLEGDKVAEKTSS